MALHYWWPQQKCFTFKKKGRKLKKSALAVEVWNHAVGWLSAVHRRLSVSSIDWCRSPPLLVECMWKEGKETMGWRWESFWWESWARSIPDCRRFSLHWKLWNKCCLDVSNGIWCRPLSPVEIIGAAKRMSGCFDWQIPWVVICGRFALPERPFLCLAACQTA